MEYDVIVVGAGPAGITAAIYCVRKGLSVMMVSENIGGQAAWSSDIENYTGYQFITGPELAQKFEDHIKKFPVELKQGYKVELIEVVPGGFNVKSDGQGYKTRAIILCPGRHPKFLNVPGEAEFRNKGVAYCATCDAPLFKGKDVAVIGGGNSAMDAAIQLMGMASKVYMVTPLLTGDKILLSKVRASDKITILDNSTVKEVKGSRFVEGLVIATNGQEQELKVSGIFVEIGSEPVQIPIIGADLEHNALGEIVVNERCETAVKGIYAAGDATNVPEKQIIVAAGQGSIAALSAFKYISTLS